MPIEIRGPMLALIIVIAGLLVIAALGGCATTKAAPPKTFKETCMDTKGELYTNEIGGLVCIYEDGKVVHDTK